MHVRALRALPALLLSLPPLTQEVFVRYEGLTPWKRVGEACVMDGVQKRSRVIEPAEVVHKEGDFREAIQCQYKYLIRRPALGGRESEAYSRESLPPPRCLLSLSEVPLLVPEVEPGRAK